MSRRLRHGSIATLPVYRTKVAELHHLLDDEAARTEAIDILSPLIDQVTSGWLRS
jgi:hypothetical protein